MHIRHIIIAIVFGIVIAFAMQYVLGGNLIGHLIVTIPAALLGAWFGVKNMNRKH